MNPFREVTSKVVVLQADDVDTDQIIPARFLKGTDKKGLGDQLFADWRERPGFPLMQPGMKGRKILLTGNNFGCGSSREHAPWALTDWGFSAIIARSFADIFKQNATKNGLLPVALTDAECSAIEAAVRENPDVAITIDLEAQRVSLPDGRTFSFTVDPFAKHCLLGGLDELGYILSFESKITEHERQTS